VTDQPSHGTRRARWGIFITTFVMGAALVVTGITTWLNQREAGVVVAEARALDLFRAVRRSLRDEVRGPHEPPSDVGEKDVDLAGLLGDFKEVGLRYVALLAPRGEVVAEAGKALGSNSPTVDPHAPGEPTLVRVGKRIRLDGALGPRRRARLVLEVEPVLAESLAASALKHLFVSSVAAALLVGLAFVFWRMAARADRFEAALGRQRRLAALGEMSAVLGHELRNPLAALKGHAQLVLERIDPESKGYKNAERVAHEAERIERLTTQILDFARTGSVDVELADPVATLHAVGDKLGAQITWDVARAPERWVFDRPRMEQVLENVLKNAMQASHGGAESTPRDTSIVVTCEVDRDVLLLRVRDQGPGFAPGDEQAVFEPFRTTRVQGTGLGLTIARRIVEAHGGSIVASNATDGGAVVEVRLPRKVLETGASRTPAKEA